MSYCNSNTDIEEFIEVLRLMVKINASNDVLLEYITDSFEALHSAGILKNVLDIAASKNITSMVNIRAEEIRAIITEDMEFQYENIKEEYERKIKEYEDERDAELEKYSENLRMEFENEYNIRTMYSLAEKKFISDPDFRQEILNMMKMDLIKSKEKGEFPKLFALTLMNCDEDEVYNNLLNSFDEDLFERYKPIILNELIIEHEEELMHEIKEKLYNDTNFISEAKKQIMKELAQKIFDRN